jgi:nucleoside-triphosphatase THEP1
VKGLLLHGMGGAGKTTLSTMLTGHLQQCSAFAGGVYKVTVQSDVKYAADTKTLITAQRKLLAQLSRKNEMRPGSLDEGAQMLAEALQQKKGEGPVFLVVDNVPEGNGGILGLLPRTLENNLAEG